MIQPIEFKPRSQQDFIGPAARLARLLENKATAARASGCPFKLLITGGPGGGKSSLVAWLAGALAGHSSSIEMVNGQQVGVDRVNGWIDGQSYRPITGGYNVKIIDELDSASNGAIGFLRTFLDRLPSFHAVLATSNKEIGDLPESLQTRFQWFNLPRPSGQDIAVLIQSFGLTSESAEIAKKSAGNVRSALLDAQSVLDRKQLEVA